MRHKQAALNETASNENHRKLILPATVRNDPDGKTTIAILPVVLFSSPLRAFALARVTQLDANASGKCCGAVQFAA